MAHRISRSEIISLLAGLPVAAAATTGLASAADDSGGTKASFKYQDTPKGAQECDKCSLFIPKNACKVVKGKISPKGWCVAFAPKAK